MGIDRLTYSLITPVRNEAENLPRLAESVLRQSFAPERWVIVDTGSTDETPQIIDELEAMRDYIVAASADEAVLKRGGPIVRAFCYGLSSIVPPTDLVVKLDADVTFSPSFFVDLIEQFEKDETLGVASGSPHEWEKGAWRQKFGTDDFVAGQCRLYRWSCLQEILPLEERIGWDGVDLVKARIAGWTTRQFHEFPFRHHRTVGARERSQAHAWYSMGDAMHFMGYRPSYVVAVAMFNAMKSPPAAAGVGGFMAAAIQRKPRHPDPRVIAYVRSRQRWRDLPRRVAEKLGQQ